MTEKETKALCKSIDGLTKAVKENSKNIDMHCDIVLHQTMIMAGLNGFDIDEEGQLVDTPCSCSDCQCEVESEKIN